MKLNNHNISNRGFGILEMVVVLAVIGIVAVSLALAMPRMMHAAKIAEARREMRAYERAVVGDPDNGYYGFIGDVGRLPRSVRDLVEHADVPIFNVEDNTYKVGMGWNGPYLDAINPGDDPTEDPWGGEYRVDDEGRIRSAGPDGEYETEDDLVFPDEGIPFGGDVRIELSGPGDYIVRIYYADNGSEKLQQLDQAPYIFKNIHRGPHAVEVWHVNDAEEKVDLVRRTLIMTGPFGGVFRIDL